VEWQQTVFITAIGLLVIFLLGAYIRRTQVQDKELTKARQRPNPDEEIRLIVHELKNALTLTDSVRDVIKQKGLNERRFNLIVDGLNRFSDVVRIADGRVGGKRVRLADVVTQSLSIMEAYPGVTVDFEPAEGEVLATEKLGGALVNLFKNAAEAMVDSADKKLYVRMENKSRRVFLIVKDTGYGIPVENIERIWERGFTTKEKGSGFGMGVIKEGIESSDGTLVMLNSSPGNGAEFVFAFRLRVGDTFA